MATTTTRNRQRLSIYMWFAGMLGVLSTLLMPLSFPEGVDVPLPLWSIKLLGLIQPAILLTLAVWAGVKLAPRVNLRAPVFEALARGRNPSTAIGPQMVAGIAAGVLGGVAFTIAGLFAPAALASLEETLDPPLAMRILYGGITEELLFRWGLMTFLVWGAWRLLQRRSASPTAGLVWCSIILTALAFAAGHLPLAFSVVEEVTAGLLTYIIGVNAAFGILFGYLYWKHGLESAMIAHATVHLVAFLIALTPLIS